MADGREIRREKRETRKERSGSENGDGLNCSLDCNSCLLNKDDDGELDTSLPPDGTAIQAVQRGPNQAPSSEMEVS
jgi:hypothetical protein